MNVKDIPENYRLIDGEARNANAPSFEIPSLPKRQGVAPKDYAKVGVEGKKGKGGERFWVLVETKFGGPDGTIFFGKIANRLVHVKGLAYGDTIAFAPKNIINIIPSIEPSTESTSSSK